MPTTRRRHLITETDEVASALDDAARRWPDDESSRSKLLVHLVEEGHRALMEDEAKRRQDRLEAIESTGGALTGSYGPDYLNHLREDWPA